MCEHGEGPEDCLLTLDHVAGRWVCWVHPPPPIPRQRTTEPIPQGER